MSQGSGERRAGPVASALWPPLAGGVAFALSQARHAQTIVLALLAQRGVASPVVWLPAFYGRSMMAPVLSTAVRVVLYPMTSVFEPDWPALEQLAATAPRPDLLVVAHFYGMTADTHTARAFADRHGALVLEDAVHLMLPVGEVGQHADFVCYSPRKYYEVPDGALLVVNGAALADEAEIAAATLVSTLENLDGQRFTYWRDRYLPWRRRRGPLKAVDFDDDSWWGVPSISSSVWMSEPTRRRIERVGAEGARRIAARELAIVERLEREIPKLTGLVPLPRLKEAVPYLLGFRASSREAAERAYALLGQAGATSGTWPDLPPEVRSEPARYGAALELRNTVLRVVPRYFERRHPLDFLDRFRS